MELTPDCSDKNIPAETTAMRIHGEKPVQQFFPSIISSIYEQQKYVPRFYLHK